MLYPRYLAPLHIRIWRDIIWYTRFFCKYILPELLVATALFALLFILLPVMAAFVV